MGTLTCFFLMHLSVIITVTVPLLLATISPAKFPWCGGPLNPLETAKTSRVATAVFFSCKEATMRLNISASFVEQAEKLCAIWRLCYAWAEEAKNAWKEKYNIDFPSFVGALQRCALPKFPRGVIYGLKSIDYFRYFASG